MLKALARLSLGVAILFAACSSASSEAPTHTIRIATGSTNGVYYPLGVALANAFNQSIPNIRAVAEPTGASIFNVEALEQGSADLGLALADVVYLAYAQGIREHNEPHPMLRGIAVLYVNVLHIITLADGGVADVADLRHGRIGYGMAVVPASAPPRIAVLDLIAQAYGIAPQDIRAERMRFSEMTRGLREGSLKAGVILAGYPFPAVTSLAKEAPVRLLALDQDAADRIRERYPFYKPALIPAGTYPGQKDDVTAVGVDNLLICRDDLDEQIVYELTKALFEALPQMVEFAADINPDLGPATPIPLHPGAARYYRERELLQ